MSDRQRGQPSAPLLKWILPLLLAGALLPAYGEDNGVTESKPLRDTVPDYSRELEAEQVSRLHNMLRTYQLEQQEAAQSQPTIEELEQRQRANDEVAKLSPIPYNINKVRLSGAEGSMALAEITRRLSDANIPESRRDYRPVCSIRTYLLGTLIAGESRSLRPVGKHHYLLKQSLQPGNTTISITGHSWEVRIPQDSQSEDYLITLYKPPGTEPQFHVIPVAELLAAQDAHVPAWLPQELRINRPG